MVELDAFAPNFRRVRDRWPDAQSLASHYDSIVLCFAGNGFDLIELIKSFLESTCITILGEFGKPMPSSDPTTTQLFVAALATLGLENSRGASKFDKVLSAYNRLTDALNEMRNEQGSVAHGKDGFLDALTINHRRIFVLAADSTLELLINALDGKEPDLRYTREPYDRFNHLHARIDKSVIVETSVDEDEDLPIIKLKLQTANLPDGLDLRIEPSRLLYSLDRSAYVELLNSTDLASAGLAATEEEFDTEEEEEDALRPVVESQPVTEIVSGYSGILSPLREEFVQYLNSLSQSAATGFTLSENIVDSLLATAEQNMGTDWTSRDVLQARLRITLRRVLIQNGLDNAIATEWSQHLVTWFKTKAPAISQGSIETVEV